MLFFREHDWMLLPGRSVFHADLRLEHRAPDDIEWHADMHFIARGARWRRVKQDDRPSLEVRLVHFQPEVRHWTQLERLSYWDLARRERIISEAGWLETRYRPAAGEDPRDSALNDHIWRIARREDRCFIVELAAFADGRDIFKQLAQTAVTPDGETVPFEPDEAFWKANAQLYLIEAIPLGIVRVEVPRNVRDPENHARQRVLAWLGLDAPEYIQRWDHATPGGEFKDHHADLHVELHYHGTYEL